MTVEPAQDAPETEPPSSNPIETSRFAMISHDLRSALSDVTGGMALLDRSGLPTATSVQLDRIQAGADALLRIMGIAFEGEGGTREPSSMVLPDRIALDGFLAEVQARWLGRAQSLGRAFLIRRGADLPETVALPHAALDRVVANLLANAFTHGGGDVVFEVSLGAKGALKMRVLDAGTGMSVDDIAKLNAAEAPPPGRGLGLQISRELTARMGGELCASVPGGRGTEICLCIPREIWQRQVGTETAGTSAGLDTDLGGLRILLAEDNPTNRLIAGEMLASLHAEVTTVTDGREALAALDANADRPFDLVLLDIEMPNMSGLDAIRAIRALPDARAGIPVVALTAYVMREHRDRIISAGANGIIAKPIVSLAELGLQVISHVDRAAATGQREGAKTQTPAGTLINDGVLEMLLRTVGPAQAATLLTQLGADIDTARRGLAAEARHGIDADRKAVRAHSHVLISLAGAIGATSIQSQAQALNSAAHHTGSGRLGALLTELMPLVDRLSAEVAAYGPIDA